MNSQEFLIRTKITPAEIRELLQPALAEQPEIIAAYLFGSVATGRHHSGSDIGIAILLARTLDLHGRKFLFDLLYPLLCRALRADVHLLFLDDASCLVQAQVFRKGELLYVRDQRQLAEFRMKSMAMIADFTPYAMMTQNGFKNRLRNAHG